MCYNTLVHKHTKAKAARGYRPKSQLKSQLSLLSPETKIGVVRFLSVCGHEYTTVQACCGSLLLFWVSLANAVNKAFTSFMQLIILYCLFWPQGFGIKLSFFSHDCFTKAFVVQCRISTKGLAQECFPQSQWSSLSSVQSCSKQKI